MNVLKLRRDGAYHYYSGTFRAETFTDKNDNDLYKMRVICGDGHCLFPYDPEAANDVLNRDGKYNIAAVRAWAGEIP